MKTFVSPNLKIVTVTEKSVITTSLQNVESNVNFIFDPNGFSGSARAAGRGFYDWDAGY